MALDSSEQVLAPNGQRLSVSGNPYGFRGPWGFEVYLQDSKGEVPLTSGVVGSFEGVVKHAGVLARLKTRSMTTVDGREIRTFEDYENPGTHFVWSGASHEVRTYVRALDVPMERFVEILDQVELNEFSDGVRIEPKRGTGTRLARMAAFNNVPDVCTLTARPAADAVGLVPSWSGRKVAGGELWRDDETDNGAQRRVGMLAHPSAVTFLHASAEAEAKLARLAETLVVTLSNADD